MKQPECPGMPQPGVPLAKARTYRSLLYILFLLGLIVLSCNLPAGINPFTPQEDLGASLENNMSLEAALAFPAEDNRPGILEQMGPPDAFTLSFEELNGQMVRQEEWSYFDDLTRMDFVDGTLLWTLRIEALPDASLYASYYDPQSFTEGISLAQVQALLPNQDLVEIDTSDQGIPGGQLVAGDQILLGFDQDRLVYVQTFPLMPEVNP